MFFFCKTLNIKAGKGSFKVERTSIFRYCNFSQPKLQPVSNFIFHSSTNDFKGFLHESFLQFPLFSLQNEGISSLCIYSWHSGSHTSPICVECHTPYRQRFWAPQDDSNIQRHILHAIFKLSFIHCVLS